MQGAQSERRARAAAGVAGEERRQRVWARLKLEARLYGLGGAWHQFEAVRSLEATARSLPARDSYGVGDPEKDLTWQSASRQRAELLQALGQEGFASIEEFEHTLAEYAGQWGPDAELHRPLAGHREEQRFYERLAAQARQKAEAEVRKVAATHPLLAQPDFERERLVGAPSEQVQALLLEYTQARQRDVAATREHLAREPELVYRLDRLLATLCIVRGIQEGSTGDLLLRARVRELEARQQRLTLVVTVLALAAGLVSAGSGTAGVLAAGVGLGLGVYDGLEQLRQYERQSAAYGAQLVSEDASLAWVVVAALGTGLDLAVVATALRAMGPALRSFQRSRDLGHLEQSLQALSRVEERLKQRVLQAAQQQLWYAEAVRKFHAAGYQLHATLLAGTEHFARALEILYYQLRQGVIGFDRIMLELRKQKLIKQVDKLTREELRRLRELSVQVVEIVEHGEAVKLSDEEVGAVVRRWAEGKGGRFTLEELKAQLSERAREVAREAASGAGERAKAGGPQGGSAAGKATREAELLRLHWRAVLGSEADQVLKAILQRTRGVAEALGELAMEVALKRLGLIAEKDFVKRYHGREKLAIDRQGRMVGVEAKGSGRAARSLSKHKDRTKQLSRRANHKRALIMYTKRAKIGKSSSRLGGPYTRGELELYAFLDERKGMKRLISVHANVETGLTRIFERDGVGNIVPSSGEPLDEFILEDLRELKAMLTKRRDKR